MHAELTPRQQAFVRAYVQLGGLNGTQAAIVAGYSPKTKGAGAAVTASRLLRDPRVKAAIDHGMALAVGTGASVGAEVLTQLALNSGNEEIRLTAATRLLRMAGVLPEEAPPAPQPKPKPPAPPPDALRDALRKLIDAPRLAELTQDRTHAGIALVPCVDLRALMELVP